MNWTVRGILGRLRGKHGATDILRERAGLCCYPGCKVAPSMTLSASEQTTLLACPAHALSWVQKGFGMKVARQPHLLAEVLRRWAALAEEDDPSPLSGPES